MGTDPIVSQQTRVGVSIACQTSDTDPIVVSNDKVAPTIIVHRSLRRKRKPNGFIQESLVVRRRMSDLKTLNECKFLHWHMYRLYEMA